ncbi:MAG TPA: NADH-quinone oxidoreductase subunit F, partial [Syntrophobacteraceae bacterium]|nr:NADH-quinone oxidoreductase subunit F [Syntrophobacteraceae bacterium]
MTAKRNTDWDRLYREGWQLLSPGIPLIAVGMASCGRAAAAEAVYQSALQASRQTNQTCTVISTGCLGFCQMEPLVEIRLPDGQGSLYGLVTPDRMAELVGACGSLVLPEDGCIGRFPALSEETSTTDHGLTALPDHPFYRGQVRLITRRCGRIDPASLEQAVAVGAYRSIEKVLSTMAPEDVIQLLQDSGLRGRGGAGYPTGRKWQTARAAPGQPKYVICNAD